MRDPGDEYEVEYAEDYFEGDDLENWETEQVFQDHEGDDDVEEDPGDGWDAEDEFEAFE